MRVNINILTLYSKLNQEIPKLPTSRFRQLLGVDFADKSIRNNLRLNFDIGPSPRIQHNVRHF